MIDTTFISFICAACNQEIEAPADMAGKETKCPACGISLTVPYIATPGTLWGDPLIDNQDPSQQQKEAIKSRTIRIELPDIW